MGISKDEGGVERNFGGAARGCREFRRSVERLKGIFRVWWPGKRWWGVFRKSLDLGMGVVLKFVLAGAEKGGTIG